MALRLEKFKRWLKYKYIGLLRAKGGASRVAMGFSIGLAVEMFTLPTFGFAFLLIFPLVIVLKGNLPAALIGFVFGKVIYIPMAFVNAIVGGWVLPDHFTVKIPFLYDWVNRALTTSLKLIVGGAIDGAVLGALLYFPIRASLEAFRNKRREKRKLQRARLEVKPVGGTQD
ncbi:DUF2062 domain-containing protein [Cohnella caldifontis]|uniref:DUF2062 domain-containing protein n=1 Tax=Cohnella caldifontis TaxID=3027471 RepID=UPI0023ECB0DB|nr:DUF2062 domain-containing protein [Cohnella sp. YIM B05605]